MTQAQDQGIFSVSLVNTLVTINCTITHNGQPIPIRVVDWDCDRGEGNPPGFGLLVAKREFSYPPDTSLQDLASYISKLILTSTFKCNDGRLLHGVSAHLGTGDHFKPDHNFLFICGGELDLEEHDPDDDVATV